MVSFSLAAATQIHKTAGGYVVYTLKGEKSTSPYDFIVCHRSPTSRLRTLRHAHLVVDMLQKRVGNPALTDELVAYFLNPLIARSTPATSYPPRLQFYSENVRSYFHDLDGFGEYEVELLLVAEELIAKSERTNYPTGSAQEHLWGDLFLGGADTHSLITAAGWSGGGRTQT